MTRHVDGTPIARHLIFALNDGTLVVQWDNERVQAIFSGNMLPFEDRAYGHAVTDAELDQLTEAGRISGYDRSYVWLHALPEGERFDRFSIREETRARARHYYLNTTLTTDHLNAVRQQLQTLGLDTQFTAQEHGELVAVMNKDGHPFVRLSEAENAHNVLRRAAGELLQDIAVAFVEFSAHSAPTGDTLETMEILDLETLIASQTRRLGSDSRTIVGVDQDEAFLTSTASTIEALGATFVPVMSGQEALHVIEDLEPDLVIMELMMSDAHAWQILARMRANQALASIPVIIVSNVESSADQVFALTVAHVHDYLVKPISPGELRKSIWTAIQPR